jgi:hypothetical protein
MSVRHGSTTRALRVLGYLMLTPVGDELLNGLPGHVHRIDCGSNHWKRAEHWTALREAYKGSQGVLQCDIQPTNLLDKKLHLKLSEFQA